MSPVRFSLAATLLLLCDLPSSLAGIVRHDCLSLHSSSLTADCADRSVLASCLAGLTGTAPDDIQSCFLDAGCSEDEAAVEAEAISRRCDRLPQGGDLRRRYLALDLRSQVSETVELAEFLRRDTATPAPTKLHGAECFTTSTIDTTTCLLTTADGVQKTQTCTPTQVARSECAPGLKCTIGVNNEDICMVLHNNLETGGIIIAIVFAVIIVVGLGSLTFLCCRDRRNQKSMAAKAEAVALARAATKKHHQESRAPLMQEQQHMQRDGAPGSPNPFMDQAH
ncbi:hypothetical protein DCS_06438 [Drechmeria coniospora]|uniref:Uncharacterized protein n=1 Tax=Drechmeria coniospora TaxID=98403 RepID=A0A151GBJ3_DRECN|nr:hypothetical protein DCS_06438 [Drechmeria coniospora]KYK54480.1 hypothetical protein DCS_06438 [Drechmeria coniospora]ODA77240.1 hypothetical protein RJ55_06867 [Drechmeria coniospora]